MPPIFDKKKLSTPEFQRFIYKGKNGSSDMNLAGYKHAIKDDIVGTEVKDVKLVQYTSERVSQIDEKVVIRNTNLWASVVVSVKTVSGEVYEACGEADLDELIPKQTHHNLVRIADSRARKRAYAQALGIMPEDFLADKTKRSHQEDIDTPMCDLDDGRPAEERTQNKPVQKKGLSLDDLMS